MAEYDYEAMFGDAARRECYEVAKEVVEEIRTSPTTPVDTGTLRDGYKANKTFEGAEVTTDVPYWKDVEYGHRVVTKDADGKRTDHGIKSAQPHVRPSIEAVKARRDS